MANAARSMPARTGADRALTGRAPYRAPRLVRITGGETGTNNGLVQDSINSTSSPAS